MAGLTELFTWTAPICGSGDHILARMHQGVVAEAKVSMVQTHYTDAREAHHSYLVRFLGHRRGQWLGECDIFKVVSPYSQRMPSMLGDEERTILIAIDKWVKPWAVAQAASISVSKAIKALKDLAKRGFSEVSHTGSYRITEAGRAALAKESKP